MMRYKCLIFLCIVFMVGFIFELTSICLDYELEALDSKNVELNGGIPIKDKGLYLLQRSVRHGDLLLIGSSELNAPVEQNPIHAYPNSDLPVNVNKIGHAYQQCLLDGIMLGALVESSSDKIAILISPQWFVGEDINKKGTQANFSELQLMKFLYNPNIPAEIKKYACTRLDDLLSGEAITTSVKFLVRLYKDDSVFSYIGRGIFWPYYAFKYRLLVLKDKYNAYKFLQNGEAADVDIHSINWKEAMDIAALQGKESCTNNSIFVYDEYYDKYLKDVWGQLAGSKKDDSLSHSMEKEDFRFLLQVSHCEYVEPYFIFVSANGFYYDYLGVQRSERVALYDWLGNEAVQNGFPYLDLREHEYEPYFYCDVMHLGWKGWTLVNENISNHFKKNL